MGWGIRDSGVDPSEIFVTTKVWTADHGYDKTLRAFEESKSKLGLDTIDLYLIHWPAKADFAEQRGRSPAQILIRWDLQHQVVTIPRSTREAHIRENCEVFDFELSAEDMTRLDALDEGKRIGPDPDTFVG